MRFRRVKKEDIKAGLKIVHEDLLKNGVCDDKDVITIVQIDHAKEKLYYDTGFWDYIDTAVECYMMKEDKSKFEELKRKAKDQIYCGIAKGVVEDYFVDITIDDFNEHCYSDSSEIWIDYLIKILDKNWEEKHSTASRNAKPKAIFEYRMPCNKYDLNELRVKGGRVLNRETLKESEIVAKNQVIDEIDELIKSRSNGTYNDISNTASDIIKALGTDSKYTYFFTQIANKLARIKNGYSVEDSLLDIAGYAKLELNKERKNERE